MNKPFRRSSSKGEGIKNYIWKKNKKTIFYIPKEVHTERARQVISKKVECESRCRHTFALTLHTVLGCCSTLRSIS